MKTRLAFYLVLIIILYGCQDNNIKNDLTKNNLNGKVKSIRENKFMVTYEFGKIEKDYRLKDDEILSLYNKSGNLYCSYQYDNDGEVSNILVLFYNEYGKIIEENHLSKDSVLYDKETSEYDKEGNMIRGLDFDKNGFVEDKLICVYEASKIIEDYSYDKDNLLYSKTYFTYDSKGNLIEKKIYNSENSLKIKKSFKYNDKDNLIEENYFRADNNKINRTSFIYDQNSNLIEEVGYNSDNSLSWRKKYTYDSFNNILTMELYNSENEMFRKNQNKFEYDKNSNWINKIEFENNKPYFIVEREIEYY